MTFSLICFMKRFECISSKYSSTVPVSYYSDDFVTIIAYVSVSRICIRIVDGCDIKRHICTQMRYAVTHFFER